MLGASDPAFMLQRSCPSATALEAARLIAATRLLQQGEAPTAESADDRSAH
jgi:hypothetical protein